VVVNFAVAEHGNVRCVRICCGRVITRLVYRQPAAPAGA
jgi:hypothetical protein